MMVHVMLRPRNPRIQIQCDLHCVKLYINFIAVNNFILPFFILFSSFFVYSSYAYYHLMFFFPYTTHWAVVGGFSDFRIHSLHVFMRFANWFRIDRKTAGTAVVYSDERNTQKDVAFTQTQRVLKIQNGNAYMKLRKKGCVCFNV